jgi:hypothetical protein
VPRHPPCALTILTVIGETLTSSPSEKSLISPRQFAVKRIALIPVHWLLCSFQGPRRGASCRSPALDRNPSQLPAAGRSLKTQQHTPNRFAIRSGEIEDFSQVNRPTGDSPSPNRFTIRWGEIEDFSQVNRPMGDSPGSVDMSSDRLHSSHGRRNSSDELVRPCSGNTVPSMRAP